MGSRGCLSPADTEEWEPQLSWEYDNVGIIASRELCMLRDPGQHQVGLVFCHVGAPRQKGDGGALRVPPSAWAQTLASLRSPHSAQSSKVACPVL